MELRQSISKWVLITAVFLPAIHAAPPPVRVVECPSGGSPIAAQMDRHGTVHLVFDSTRGPCYAASTDNGQTFSSPLCIVDAQAQAKSPGLEFTIWDLAVSPQGHVHVALGTNAWKLKLPQEEWGFYYARLAPGDDSFTPVRNINHKPSEGFSLAADPEGNVTACWLSDKLYANVSHDQGTSFGPTIEIDPHFNPCNCCTTSITYGQDGRLAVLYREETNNDRDMYLALWDQAQNQVVRSSVSTTKWNVDACPMTYYCVVPDAAGYLAVWPTRRHVYFARLDPNGMLLPPEEIATKGLSGMRSGVLSLVNSRGEILIAWNDGDDFVGWQIFDAAGRPMGKPDGSSCSGKGAAGFVAPNGTFVLFR